MAVLRVLRVCGGGAAGQVSLRKW